MIPFIEAKKDNMYQSAKQGFSTATDLADYLVNLDIPFREAHESVGVAVQNAIQKNCGLEDLELSVLQSINNKIGDDVYSYLTLEGSVNSRDHIGGTAPKQVKQAIERAKERLKNL
jgi:argininosuccinate lyase